MLKLMEAPPQTACQSLFLYNLDDFCLSCLLYLPEHQSHHLSRFINPSVSTARILRWIARNFEAANQLRLLLFDYYSHFFTTFAPSRTIFRHGFGSGAYAADARGIRISPARHDEPRMKYGILTGHGIVVRIAHGSSSKGEKWKE